MSKILVVEDEKSLVDLLCIHLKDLQLEVDVAFDGEEGLGLAKNNQYALIVTDVMMPKMDGIQLCTNLRGQGVLTPILMLTAKSDEFDKVLGLEVGADDYLTKPFSIREFIARVKAILRRSQINNPTPKSVILKFNDLELNEEKRKVSLNGSAIDLTPKEFELLQLLMQNPGKSFSRESLLKRVWGYDFGGYEHTVNSHVNRLRAKIEKDPNEPEYIKTIWGVGYAFAD
jgi:DNA-binding response OmpR family regulator